MARTIWQIPGDHLDLKKISDHEALLIRNVTDNHYNVVCDVCGLELRSNVGFIPAYLQPFINDINLSDETETKLVQTMRSIDANPYCSFRDFMLNIQRNVEDLLTISCAGGMKQEFAKKLIQLLIITDKKKEIKFWNNVQGFETGLVHVVIKHSDKLQQFFHPSKTDDDKVIAFAKEKVLEAMHHHTLLQEGLPTIRHAHRQNDVRAHLFDLSSMLLTGEERQCRVTSTALKILKDVISQNIGIDRASILVAAAIICVACDVSNEVPPNMELLATECSIKKGAILGLKEEIQQAIAGN